MSCIDFYGIPELDWKSLHNWHIEKNIHFYVYATLDYFGCDFCLFRVLIWQITNHHELVARNDEMANMCVNLVEVKGHFWPVYKLHLLCLHKFGEFMYNYKFGVYYIGAIIFILWTRQTRLLVMKRFTSCSCDSGPST